MNDEDTCVIGDDIDYVEVEPVFSSKKNKNIKKVKLKKDGINNIRVDVDSELWRYFKIIVQLRNLDKSTALNQAMRLFIDTDKDLKYTCVKCGNNINGIDFFISIRNGEYFYYCSNKCYGKMGDIIN